MNPFRLALRMLAVTFLGAAGCHAVLGVAAERLLDASLPAEMLRYASLDSQNRFYGTMFGVTGIALWICAADLQRYDPIIRCLLWGFLLGGVARLGAVLRNGWPSAPVTVLLVIELAVAPILLSWHNAIQRREGLGAAHDVDRKLR